MCLSMCGPWPVPFDCCGCSVCETVMGAVHARGGGTSGVGVLCYCLGIRPDLRGASVTGW